MSHVRYMGGLLRFFFLGRCCRAVKQLSGRGATRLVPNASGGQLGERPRPQLLRGYLRR